MIDRYFKYRIKAKGVQSIHSPFLFKFYNDVIKFKGNQGSKSCAEVLKKSLHSDVLIDASGFGAGSRKKPKPRKVKSIAKLSGSSARWGRFLFKMAEQFGGETIIEMGTNLGIGTTYLTCGNQSSTVHTFEGNQALYQFSSEHFKQNHLHNVVPHLGSIHETLPRVLQGKEQVDLVYIDADHTYKATLNFYEILKPYLKEKTVIIFDDIHWSKGMEAAWEMIIKEPNVTLSLDLFFKGIVFFDPKLSKEHFILKH